MNVLAIDTAGPVAGAALWCDGRVLERRERTVRGTEALLVPWAEALAAEAGIGLGDLDGVAVSRGPGAFTGLRVGLSTALGLAMALDVPLWTCDSLTPRARTASTDLPLLVMLDARKARVYAARFDPECSEGPADVPPAQALAWMGPGPWCATGEGALVYADLVREAGGSVLPDADNPGAAALAALGADALGRGEGSRAVELAPLYLREADAKPPKAR